MKHKRKSASNPRLVTTAPDAIAANAPEISSTESNMPIINPREGLLLTTAIKANNAGLWKPKDSP